MQAFSETTFARAADDKGWTISFTDREGYIRAADALKRKQLAKAGARLAALLNFIWP